MTDLTRDELEREVAAVPMWWHPVDLGQGVVAPGRKQSAEAMRAERETLRIPSLSGRNVLDIGAWDGYYAFHAEQAGAARVVALDHFVWEREEFGGGRGFDLAHRALGSSVEKVHADWERIDPATVGTFDVVLFLGVLYHLTDPHGGLEQLLKYVAPGGVAIVETQAVSLLGHEDRALAQYFPGAELNDDATNWWSPNMAGLTGLCRGAGFDSIEVVQGPSWRTRLHPAGVYRAIVHARRAG